MKSSVRTALVSTLLFLALPAWADFDHAKQAYADGQYDTAFKELQPLAEAGNPQAQGLLGKLYMKGLGTPKDNDKARFWLNKAADQGNTEAGYDLGYIIGRGIDWKDVKTPNSDDNIVTDADGKLVAYRMHGLTLEIPAGFKGPVKLDKQSNDAGIVFRNDLASRNTAVTMQMFSNPLQGSDLANQEAGPACKTMLNFVGQLTAKSRPSFKAGKVEDASVGGLPGAKMSILDIAGLTVDKGQMYCVIADGRNFLIRVDQVGPQTSDEMRPAIKAIEAATIQAEPAAAK